MSLLYKIAIPLLAVGAFVLFSAELMNGNGSPGAHTGSPGDGDATCTQCHGGTAMAQSGWLSSDIPLTGYIPGQTYTITATLTHTGAVRYGFELTAEDATASKVGTFIITNSAETKLTNADQAVTHTFNGTNGSGGSKSWTFNWEAPPAGTGDVTFYSAFNAANGNGTTSGDVIYTSTLMSMEDISTGLSQFTSSAQMHVYPNPATDKLFINWRALTDEVQYRLIDLQGKVWDKHFLQGESHEVLVGHLPRGVYILNLGDQMTRRIILQ